MCIGVHDIYLYIHISLARSLSLYIYIHIHINPCIYEKLRERPLDADTHLMTKAVPQIRDMTFFQSSNFSHPDVLRNNMKSGWLITSVLFEVPLCLYERRMNCSGKL